MISRILTAAGTVFAAIIVVFLAVRGLPGDPALAMLGLGSGATPTDAQLAEARERFGFDQPIWAQFGMYISALFRGDMGISSATGLPVTTIVINRMQPTLLLILFATVVSLVIGVVGGLLAARYQGRILDRTLTGLTSLILAIPNFWLGMLLILTFALTFRIFPASGYKPLSEGIGLTLLSLTLPAVMLGAAHGAVLLRQLRGDLIEANGAEYTLTARAKGISEGKILFRHALPNGITNSVTIAGLQVGMLIGGTVVAEQVFVIPGFGKLLLDSVGARDYAVIQAVAIIMVVAFVCINLCTDLLYRWMDPRAAKGGIRA